MAELATSATLALPDWLVRRLEALPAALPDQGDQIELVLELSRKNFEHDTGGPFAALVAESATGKLVSVAVNRAVPLACSSAHAEVMALTLAQQSLGGFDLGGPGVPAHTLVVNWRPCAMCFGAVLWSGVRSLVTAGGGGVLTELTGFDEGPLVENWESELGSRGIRVADSVAQDRALDVMRAFSRSGRAVYNARGG